MKAFILFFFIIYMVYFTLVTTTEVIPFVTQLLFRNSFGQLEIEDLTRKIIYTPPRESDIKLYFHTRNGPIDGIEVNTNDSEAVVAAGFSKEKSTMFIVHGWTNAYNSPVIRKISKAVLETQDINVFGVDWSNIARREYLVASSSVPDVGRLLGTIIKRLVTNNGLDLNRTTVVGHSLGAHVSGKACAYNDGNCSCIVGLDPASPNFPPNETEKRLNTGNAAYVHVIHTNGGMLGMSVSIGHSDVFPNGGSMQPGCILDITGFCSHIRSFELYAESLSTGNFVTNKCSNYTDYENGRCANQSETFMGQYPVDRSARGNYYLDTFSSSLYAMGKRSWS